MESKPSVQLRDYEIPIFNDFVLNANKKLGSGSFGDVYLGTKINNREEKFAIKLENKLAKSYYSFFFNGYLCVKKRGNHSRLNKEKNIYAILNGVKRIPKIYSFGEQGNYRILIMDLLGHSLKDYMKYIKSPFSLGTTIKLSVQILDILKDIHKKGIVLRYLKPGNMAMGRGENKDYVYLLDFGLAKQYIKYGFHIPYKENKNTKGNRDFISINIQSGGQLSRRDDIECLGYNLVYFMKGKLPWSDMKSNHSVRQKKIETSLDELCEGLPEEFKEFIKYAREMKFTEEPDYEYLKNLLLKAAEKNNIKIDSIKYDWDIYSEKLENEKKKGTKENEYTEEKEVKDKEVKNGNKIQEKDENPKNNCEDNVKEEESKIIDAFEEKVVIKDEK